MSCQRRYVWHDPAMGMAGVFRPLVKSSKRQKLDVEMHWKRASFHWRGPDQLGIGDQSVLFAVLEAAGEHLHESPSDARADATDTLWDLLGHQKHVFRNDTLLVTASFSRLARLCGWSDGGSSLKRVMDSLRRLTETTVWVRQVNEDGEAFEGSSRLLAWRLGDRKSVALIVNWRLAQALHGAHYSRISLDERACLHTEVARALHALLSCRVSPGKAWSCSLEKLQVHVWGDALTGAGLRTRRVRLRRALEAIGAMRGWGITFDADVVRIGRGRIASTANVASTLRVRPVATVTPRLIENESPSLPKQPLGEKSNADSDLQNFDVSALFSTRERHA